MESSGAPWNRGPSRKVRLDLPGLCPRGSAPKRGGVQHKGTEGDAKDAWLRLATTRYIKAGTHCYSISGAHESVFSINVGSGRKIPC